jgi:hypothetical protein
MSKVGSSRSVLGRVAASLLLLGLLAVVATSVSQCRLAPDRVASTELETSHGGGGLSRCVKFCTALFNALMEAENRLHNAILKACKGDAACIEHENQRHERVVKKIEAGRDSCLARCHHQGSGSGR